VIRFAFVTMFAFAALAGAMVLADAHAQLKPSPPGAAIAGEWTGRYICAQGVTALRLDVSRGSGNQIAATFNFGPTPENPEVPKGAYTMAGTFDPASRHMTLKGVEWIEAPFLYVMVDLDGRINAAGNVIAGDVPGPGCTVFELRRDAQLIG